MKKGSFPVVCCLFLVALLIWADKSQSTMVALDDPNLNGSLIRFDPGIESANLSEVGAGAVGFTNAPLVGNTIIFEEFIASAPLAANPGLALSPSNHFSAEASLWFEVPIGSDPSLLTGGLIANYSGTTAQNFPDLDATYNLRRSDFGTYDLGVTSSNLSLATADIQVISSVEFSVTFDPLIPFGNPTFLFNETTLRTGGVDLLVGSFDVDFDRNLINPNPPSPGAFHIPLGVSTNLLPSGERELTYIGLSTNLVSVPLTGGEALIDAGYFHQSGVLQTNSAGIFANDVTYDFARTFSTEFNVITPGVTISTVPEPAVPGLLILLGLYAVMRRQAGKRK